MEINVFRASFGTLISHGIFIFPRENELIYLGKMKIPWEISVPKLALNVYNVCLITTMDKYDILPAFQCYCIED
jgi:hypothetical protein